MYKDHQGPELRANHIKTNNTTNQPDDPQIPQPDLRFVKRNSKPDTQKGPEPKQNTHKDDLPTDTVV